jgi:hypothetical protein
MDGWIFTVSLRALYVFATSPRALSKSSAPYLCIEKVTFYPGLIHIFLRLTGSVSLLAHVLSPACVLSVSRCGPLLGIDPA